MTNFIDEVKLGARHGPVLGVSPWAMLIREGIGRVIAATNRDSWQEVTASRFRGDLYYRLNVVALKTIALKDRPEDIAILASNFLAKLAVDHGLPLKELSSAALRRMRCCDWPGNVREMENILERAVLFTEGRIIGPEATRVFGNSSKLEIDGKPDFSTLLRWDLGSVPANATILSATISVHAVATSNDLFELYALKRPWVESEANFLEASSGDLWEVSGASGAGDRGTTVLGRLTAPTLGPATVEFSAAGLAVLQSWLGNPQSNHGFIFQDYTDATTDDLDFRSSEASNVEERPKLVIAYTPELVDAAMLLEE